MLRDILRFEWCYQTRRLTFLAVAACFALIGFALAATAFGPNDIHLNSPYSIAESIGLASLVAVLVATFFCAHGALRDTEHGMAEIVYATAITKRDYVFGRYVGMAAAAFAAFAFVVPGLLAGTFLVAHDAERVARFAPLPYLASFALLALPNLLFVTAVLFAIALMTRSALATYVGGVLVYAVYFIAMLFSGSPLMANASPPTARGMAIAALADPFGLSAFFEQTRYWTAAERDARPFELGGHLLANRVVWLAVTGVILLGVYRRFEFGLWSAAAMPPLSRARNSGGMAAALQMDSPLASATLFELRHALRSWPLLALLLGWIATSTVELTQTFRQAEFGTAIYPATGLVIGELWLPLSLFGLLMLFYYAAELVWRERAARMDAIVDATPVSSSSLLLAKVAALGALIALLLAVAIGSAMAFQLFSGWSALEPHVYASLFLFIGLPLLFVAVLAVLIQTLIPNRYLGIVVSALVVFFWHRGALGGPDHPLLRFAAAPEVPYSDLSGFGAEAVSFAWFSAYWGAFVIVLLALAAAAWRRGALRHGWTRASRKLAAIATIVWIALGAAVFVQTNRWNTYRTAKEVEAWRAEYERKYRALDDEPQPSIVDVRTNVDLHPESRRYDVHGRYVLENRTTRAIEHLSVTARRDLARVDLRLDGKPPATVDATYGTYRFDFAPPLARGARTTLDFDVAVVRRGAMAGSAERGIVPNGTFLFSTFSLPSLGYRRSYELQNPQARQRNGLPPLERAATMEAADQAGLGGAPAPLTFETTLTTAPGQIALAPGELVERGTRHGRNFFRYRNDHAITPFAAFASGRYAVARRVHDGITIDVDYHPAHDRNVQAILNAAELALHYCRAQFGPYPFRELRIAEVPSTWTGFTGFATPGLIFMVEDGGFLTDRSNGERVDVVTKRIAHEVAHQWWGHQVSPTAQPGAAALVETLARYTELRVLAALHGESAATLALTYESDRYLSGRANGDEVPLAAVRDQQWIYYAKGALVMNAIRDLIGEAATNAALRQLVDDVRAGHQPAPRDLLTYLQRNAQNEEQRALIAEWWNGIVLYDLRVTNAHATPIASNRVRLDVTIDARKSDRGIQQPLDEELELGVYDADGAPLQRARYRVRGRETISIDADARARRVVIDPGYLRIDRDRGDNERAVH